MNKNMYSLMLSEDVVALVDKLAYESGTNRSSMVNNILAEYLSYQTPEMRVKEMLETLGALFSANDALQVMLSSSANTFSLRSALAFKYNPTINYSIELYRSRGAVVGEMRAGLRTQNVSLKLYIMQFYKLWAKIEQSYTGTGDYAIEAEKFTKKLTLHGQAEASDEELSQAIADYVCAFDEAIKAFFYNLEDTGAAVAQVESVYRAYYRSAAMLL